MMSYFPIPEQPDLKARSRKKQGRQIESNPGFRPQTAGLSSVDQSHFPAR
jgi:hypothetical protein